MTTLREALERVRYMAEHGMFTAVDADMHMSYSEIADVLSSAALDSTGWREIAEATESIDECWLWCADMRRAVLGRVAVKGDRQSYASGAGMVGNWTFSHFMPLARPSAPLPPATGGSSHD